MHGEVVRVYFGALKAVWQVAIAFAALGFRLSGLEKEVELRQTLKTEYGIRDAKVHST